MNTYNWHRKSCEMLLYQNVEILAQSGMQKLQQQIQTDLHISAFILAQGGVQYVWQ